MNKDKTVRSPMNKDKAGKANKTKGVFDEELEDFVARNKTTTKPMNKNRTAKANKTNGFFGKIKSFFFVEEEEEEFDAEEIEDFVSAKNKTVRPDKSQKVNKTLKNKVDKANKTKGFFDKVKAFFFAEEEQEEEIEDFSTGKNKTVSPKAIRPPMNKGNAGKTNKTKGVFDEELEDFVARNKTGGVKPPKKDLTKSVAKKNETKKTIME